MKPGDVVKTPHGTARVIKIVEPCRTIIVAQLPTARVDDAYIMVFPEAQVYQAEPAYYIPPLPYWALTVRAM